MTVEPFEAAAPVRLLELDFSIRKQMKVFLSKKNENRDFESTDGDGPKLELWMMEGNVWLDMGIVVSQGFANPAILRWEK